MIIEKVGAVKTNMYVNKSGHEMRTCTVLKDLKKRLNALKGKELNATSCVAFRPGTDPKEYLGLIIIKDDNIQPKIPNEKFPVNNKVLREIVRNLSDNYGEKADDKELAFLDGGLRPPGYCQVTLMGTGLGLYFGIKTGLPMRKLIA